MMSRVARMLSRRCMLGAVDVASQDFRSSVVATGGSALPSLQFSTYYDRFLSFPWTVQQMPEAPGQSATAAQEREFAVTASTHHHHHVHHHHHHESTGSKEEIMATYASIESEFATSSAAPANAQQLEQAVVQLTDEMQFSELGGLLCNKAVLKKRRMKMNKHKHRKRLKRMKNKK